MTSTLRSLALSLIALALCSSLALAQEGQLGTPEPEIEPAKPAEPGSQRVLGRMDNNLSGFLIIALNYDVGLGLGVRYQKTIVPEGFIKHHRITDDLGIEGSLEWRHYSWNDYSYNQYNIGAGVVWNVWFTPEFAAYPKIGLGYGISSWSDEFYDNDDYGGFLIWFAAGVIYRLGPVTLRAELGTDSLQGGVGYTF